MLRALGRKRLFFTLIFLNFLEIVNIFMGARGGVVVKALHYKPAGRGFDSRWCHWSFSVT